MSQSGLTDPSREADWDAWYLQHLGLMVAVVGVDSAQRFKTATPGYPPSLAVYSMCSAAVFEDPYYLSIRGLGEFLPLIDRRHYKRNLFAGLDRAPAVKANQVLLVWDAGSAQQESGIGFTWLEAVAIDRSTRYRGIAVVDARQASAHGDDLGFACYRPASAVFHKPAAAAP